MKNNEDIMLEIGEYVRTKNKGIKQVLRIDDTHYRTTYKKELYIPTNKGMTKYSDITNHSENIIDLIEVGDYVNGHKVCMDLKGSKKHYNSKNDFITCKDYTFENDEIETVLTKEQFTANSYDLEKER